MQPASNEEPNKGCELFNGYKGYYLHDKTWASNCTCLIIYWNKPRVVWRMATWYKKIGSSRLLYPEGIMCVVHGSLKNTIHFPQRPSLKGKDPY